MQTIHLTDDHVRAYLGEFAQRMAEWQHRDQVPEVWVTVGASGSIMGKRLVEIAPALYERADELIVAYNRSTDVVSFPTEKNPQKIVKGKRVLVIDGTVHSGGTLLRVLSELQKLGAKKMTCYALAVRRGSKVIPNHFGFLIGDHDRVQFPSPLLSNNCLCAYGVYRKINKQDAGRKMISTGTDFIDKVSWEDRLYETTTDKRRHVYLHEENRVVCGFVSFRFTRNKTVLVDEVAVDKKYRGRRLGGHLMRWAEHCARHKNCSRIELWAVQDKVKFYEHLGYESKGKEPLHLSGEDFWRMHKKLLYNLANDDTLAMGL
jgi:GNAT superfamily N-acetyltransferase/hypoxanthine-guanine phosphoribosyltransferase